MEGKVAALRATAIGAGVGAGVLTREKAVRREEMEMDAEAEIKDRTIIVFYMTCIEPKMSVMF